MPGFPDLRAVLGAQIVMEEDFTFDSTKGELALKIRNEHLATICKLWTVPEATVSIDSDGDVVITSEKGRLYITGNAILVAGLNFRIASIAKGWELAQIGGVLDELCKYRGPLIRAQAFQLRLFFRLLFNQPTVPQILQFHNFFLGITTSVDSSLHPTKIKTLLWRARYQEEPFTDTLELNIQPSDFEIRYIREVKVNSDLFTTFTEFASLAGIGEVTERVRPFVEPLIFDITKLRGSPFAQ